MIDEHRLRRLEGERRLALPVGSAVVPNVIDFATGPGFLNQKLFPRQATWLKLVFCASELLTDYDRQVLEEWTGGFEPRLNSDGTAGYRGGYGVVPDVLERMGHCHARGRSWFREVVMVGGRRGSKGFLGAVSTAYVLWHQLAIPNLHELYGLPRGKQIHALVFAGQRDQALTNQWRDLADVIQSARCFEPFIANVGRDTLRLFSSAQAAAGGVRPEDAAFVISAKEATTLAGRGPAALVEVFDEMAHMVAGGANRSAEEVFSAATPALSQFRTQSFLFEASSPWQQQGQFYANYLRGLAIDPETGQSIDRDVLVLQLPSHELYRDWELTATAAVDAWPGGPALARRGHPIFDASDADQQRRTDPDGFDVEYGAQWATSVSAYLRPEDVDQLFAGWAGQPLQARYRGSLGTRYVAHADPSVSGANFAVVVAHREEDDQGHGHVIVDHIHVWRPADFADGRIDYPQVTEVLKSLMTRFRISSFTVDQFNSAGLMADLKSFARAAQLPQQTMVSERTATGASNLRMYETLKTALSRRLVHAPHHELLEAELRNLETRNGRVDHPTRGPVQTSDVADCLMNVVDVLIGDNNSDQFASSLGAVGIHGSLAAHPLSEAFGNVHRAQGAGLPRGERRDAARGWRTSARRRV